MSILKTVSKFIDGDWLIYKIEVRENDLSETIKLFQINMNEGNWYFHAYNKDGSKLIVVFKNKVFQADNNPKHWNAIIDYGVGQGTPREQLDFSPNTFAEEKY